MDRYLAFVEEEARKLGKVFFLDSGEGKDWGSLDDEWYVEELSGWLVDEADAGALMQVVATQGKMALFRLYTDQYCAVYWDLVPSAAPGEPPVTVRFEYLPKYED